MYGVLFRGRLSGGDKLETENPVILVYRRTHKGDPNAEEGRFGINDCMGEVRCWKYDAVIGIGGSKPWPEDDGIKEKITWIGRGPQWIDPSQADIKHMVEHNKNFKGFRASMVVFDKFLLLDEKGYSVKDEAPNLHNYMFKQGRVPRAAKTFPPEVYAELKKILRFADNAAPSPARDAQICLSPRNSPCASSDRKTKSLGCA